MAAADLQRFLIRLARRPGAAVALRLLPLVCSVLSAGCVLPESCCFLGERPPRGEVCQISATWEPQVVFPQDVVNGGVKLPSLIGRLYLFGPEVGFPVTGDGDVTVTLYIDNGHPDGKPLKLEEWNFKQEQLKLLLRKDGTIGWGYTLILPWGTWNEALTRVQLATCYRRKDGVPLYTPCSPVTLRQPERPVMPRVMLDAPRAAPAP